jgi:transcription elongation factor Elf1
MPIVNCKNCGQEMVIDEPNGIAYITYEDGSISHVTEPVEEQPQTEEVQPTEETGV